MSKYRAVRTGKYASKKEARRAEELKLLEKIDAIRSVKEQVRFTLIEKSKFGPAIVYIADSTYYELADGDWKPVVEDVKGFKTPVYRLKKRMMAEKYGIEVREV